MDWSAVRAWILAGLAVPLAVGLGLADPVALLDGDPDGVAVPLADGSTR
jgi:hypothetical protein